MIDSHPARTLDSLSYQYLHTEVSKWSNSIVGIYIPRLTCVCIGSCLYLNYVVLQIGLFTILLFLPFSLSMLVVRWSYYLYYPFRCFHFGPSTIHSHIHVKWHLKRPLNVYGIDRIRFAFTCQCCLVKSPYNHSTRLLSLLSMEHPVEKFDFIKVSPPRTYFTSVRMSLTEKVLA